MNFAPSKNQTERSFILALDNVPDSIFIVDSQGIIVSSNRAGTNILQMSREDLKGVPLSKFFPQLSGNPENLLPKSEQILSESDYIFDVTICPVSLGENDDYLVILRDITHQKKTELQLNHNAAELAATLKQLQKAQSQLIQTEKMSSLGQLIAGIAHEINNPVNFIYGNLIYIKDYCNALVKLIELYEKNECKNSQEIEDYINEIDLYFIKQDLPKILSSVESGAERIRQIVLTLRNFSRLDEAEMKAVDIHEGINSTLLILQHRLKPKPGYPGITIMKKYGKLPHILCYAGQLNQVFMNILTNSIDALQELEENQKKIPAPCIIIKTELIKENHWVRISIKDNGIGMNEEVRKHLFDPFFTTKAVGKGTGLGLSISYEIIVNKHQGKLECISSPGNGAEFMIEIPVQ